MRGTVALAAPTDRIAPTHAHDLLLSRRISGCHTRLGNLIPPLNRISPRAYPHTMLFRRKESRDPIAEFWAWWSTVRDDVAVAIGAGTVERFSDGFNAR